jgi:hypothetical protein
MISDTKQGKEGELTSTYIIFNNKKGKKEGIACSIIKRKIRKGTNVISSPQWMMVELPAKYRVATRSYGWIVKSPLGIRVTLGDSFSSSSWDMHKRS